MGNNDNTNIEDENIKDNNIENKQIDIESINAKLDEILGKAVEQKENAVLKSVYREAGLSDDEVKEAIATYKETKKSKEPDFEELNTKISTYEKQLVQEKINNAATLELIKEGIKVEQTPYVLKLIDLDGVLDDKDGIDSEIIKERISKVFEVFPNLKETKKEVNGFKEIGEKDEEKEINNISDNIRKMMGLD